MNYKWIGAMLVLSGCGCFGFGVATRYRREERILRQLYRIIEYMECELQFSLVALPELCRHAGTESNDILQKLFMDLTRELDWQLSPDVYSCMRIALQRNPEIPPSARKLLMQMGRTLGSFDLPGQLQEFASLKRACERELKSLETNRDTRLRSYQTLGLCAGAALVILFI